MLTSLRLPALLVITLLSTGCAVTADRYQTTADNQQRIKTLNTQINVGKFTANQSEYKVLCRLANNVDMPDGKSFEGYIESALVEELKLAGMYSQASKITINGNLNRTAVSSGVTDAHWTFDLTVSNGSGNQFTVVHKRKYSASFLGGFACGNDMPKSFLPTVQELIGKIVNHPKFEILVSNNKYDKEIYSVNP